MKHLFKLSLLLLALLLPGNATAYDFEVDGIYYSFTSDNQVTVTNLGIYEEDEEWLIFTPSYTGNVTIPEYVTYEGTTYSVTSIGDEAFCYCSGLTSVTIPSSVTSIGYDAFSGCTSLTSITIPNSVTCIGSNAFSGTAWYKNQPDGLVYAGLVAYKYKGSMPAGTSIILADGTLGIAGFAFFDCSGLTSIDIPNSVTCIGSNAFSGTAWYKNQPDGLVYAGLVAYKYKGSMPAGTSIILADGTLGIAGEAFGYSVGLTSLTIPNSVISIGDDAFAHCRGLTNLTVASDNPKYDSRNNCNAIIETATNTLKAGCKATVIPNSVIRIGDRAFSDCIGLTSMTLPNSLTSIGENAFSGCSGLTSVTIPNSVNHIGNCAFLYCSGLTSVIVESENPKYDSRNNCNAIIESARNTLISGCMNTTIPNSVVSIEECAFSGCSGLISLTIPNSVTSIGGSAFSYCSDLSSVTIGNSVTSIGNSAFEGTAWYKNQPNGLVYAGRVAYKYKGNMPTGSSIILADGTLGIAESAFAYCSGLTSVTIPNSIKCIGRNAFSDCSSLAVITVESGNSTFDSRNNCNAIIETASNTLIVGCKATNIPNSVTCIGSYAFSGCSGLKNVTIPNSVTSIGNSAFINCSGLTYLTVNIRNSITNIGSNAFYGCHRLTTVDIPNSVTSIGYGAFYYCYGLNDVFSFIDDPTTVSMGSDAFYQDPDYAVRTLHVPFGTSGAYQANTEWSYYFGSIVEMAPILSTSISLNKTNATMTEGETVQLTATVLPTYATNRTVTWKSSDDVIAAVDVTGLVTALAPGTATITAMTTDGSNLSASCVVKVYTEMNGDVDGSGLVNISDVTALIDFLLNGDVSAIVPSNADSDGNGTVNISDVTALIDYLLTGHWPE